MNIERKSLEERLEVLKAERRKGHEQLAGLQLRQEETRQILLRIEGAIQVLEELLQPAQPESEKTRIAAVQ